MTNGRCVVRAALDTTSPGSQPIHKTRVHLLIRGSDSNSSSLGIF